MIEFKKVFCWLLGSHSVEQQRDKEKEKKKKKKEEEKEEKNGGSTYTVYTVYTHSICVNELFDSNGVLSQCHTVHLT